ncbi:hypothetical protein IWW50_005334, partial [Coemansia erecta]
FAFVEFEDSHDAADAFDRMHDQYVGDSRIAVQWAKRPPSRSWRFERDERRDDRRGGRGRSRSRSRSPYGGRSRHRSRSRSFSRERGFERDTRDRYDDRRRDESPRGRRPDSRSRSPIRRDESPRGRRPDSRSRSPIRRDDSLERGGGRPRSLSPREYSRSPSRSPAPRADDDGANGEPLPEHDVPEVEANGHDDVVMDAHSPEPSGEAAHQDDNSE